jgi:hypothetical protein
MSYTDGLKSVMNCRFTPEFVGNGSRCTPGTSSYGGAGFALSIALMNSVDAEPIKKLAPALYVWGDYTLAQQLFAQVRTIR